MVLVSHVGKLLSPEALLLFANNPSFGSLRSGTDAYLIRGIAALAGSVLIDKPVAAYRMHSQNVFTKRTPLANFRTWDSRGLEANNAAMRLLIDHLIEEAPFFSEILLNKFDLFNAVKALSGVWPRLASDKPEFNCYATEKVAANYEVLASVFGRAEARGFKDDLEAMFTEPLVNKVKSSAINSFLTSLPFAGRKTKTEDEGKI